MCSAAGAKVRPEYPPERLIIEVDAAGREHSVFYMRQHFVVAASPGGGYTVTHTATADPAVTSRLDAAFDDTTVESPYHAAGGIRYIIDGGLAGGILPSDAWLTPRPAQGLDIG